MKPAIIIPIYLSQENNKWEEGDTVYDHPTPINEKGTLVTTLESLKTIEKEDFDVILVVSTTNSSLYDQVDGWINKRISESKYVPPNIFIFSKPDLDNLSKSITKKDDSKNLLSIQGYSQIRNCGFIAGILNKNDFIIFLDDDEIIQDVNFIKKTKQGLNNKHNNKKIQLITGACPEGKTGSYIRERKYSPWMTYWDKIKFQNEAFQKTFGSKNRFAISPFTHGGLCIIHRDIFEKIPFDPNIQRGEDMDYNINCRMFGKNFYTDNTLEIRHCPPPRIHPQWRRFREDMTRFFLQRNKIKNQKKNSGITKFVKPSDFNPYPGQFLKSDLEEKVFKSQTTLALEYLTEGDLNSARETLKNIDIMRQLSNTNVNYFDKYIQTKKSWGMLVRELEKSEFVLRKI